MSSQRQQAPGFPESSENEDEDDDNGNNTDGSCFFFVLDMLKPPNNFMGKYCYNHFTDEETEAAVLA